MVGTQNRASEYPWLVLGDGESPVTYAQLFEEIAHPTKTSASPRELCATLVTIVRALVFGQDLTCVDGRATVSGEASTGQGELGGESADVVPTPAELIATRLRENCRSRVTFQTSGTSGLPKQYTHTLEHLRRGVVVGEKHRCDVWGLAYPPTTMAGFQVCLQAFCNGNGIVDLRGVRREEVLRRCREWGVNRLSATPTFFRMLLPVRPPFGAMRSCTLGGEVADSRLVQDLREAFTGARIHNIYALTEAGTVLRAEGEEFSVPGELLNLVKIEEGRVWLNRALLAADQRTGEWFDTGDLVEVTCGNPLRFRMLGRAGTVINVGGAKVNPEEVERVLLTFAGIVGARVAGRRNSVTGMVLEAEVVWRDEARPEEELRHFLQSRLPPAWIPRILRAVDRLVLTSSGKVRRDE